MSDLTRQERFQKSKDGLDRALKIIDRLASDAQDEGVACCRSDMLDQRDQFTVIAAHLRAAQAEMLKARAEAGKIEGDGIARSGGT